MSRRKHPDRGGARVSSSPRSSPSSRRVSATDLCHPHNAPALQAMQHLLDTVAHTKQLHRSPAYNKLHYPNGLDGDAHDDEDDVAVCCDDGLMCSRNIPRGLFSVSYALVVSFITACVMTIVHERVPNTAMYPPLPDLMLDNLPHIPWAFEVCEVFILTMAVIFCTMLAGHKQRWIVFRRFMAITGTVFFLRCITMFVTSLSVPGTHLKCDVPIGATREEKFRHAIRIFTHFGLSVSGLKTCGDYMFSGHSVMLTLLNYFINEYTPQDWRGLHTVTWVFNCFGMFFILAAHEHYTLDVLVAFYISSRLFLYYHNLQPPRKGAAGYRVRLFFPMFSYLEECMIGDVPNEYEWPWASFRRWIESDRDP
eukprot:TRINITY_DN4718_c3_g1_i1.p1 TRINITY_DN4718_c3_g1~~TRINITY_DN4718_c3_g1_i1.p1  ORF type:complete len:366 (+),score=37.65 TRINITY_DN4718_c3_g1_i1:74-1171(+)